LVLPDDYTVRVMVGSDSVSGTVVVEADPRLDTPAAERERKYAAILEAGRRLEVSAEAVKRIRDVKRGVTTVLEALEDNEPPVSTALGRVYSSLQSSWDSPTQSQRLNMEQSLSGLEEALAEFNRVISTEVAGYRSAVQSVGLDLVPAVESIGR
jgi:hypothetical protein